MMMLDVAIKKKLGKFSLSVSFRVEGGERLGLLGPSGSGKSVTLKCIAGILGPDHGHVVFNDKVLFDDRSKIDVPTRERKVGYLFQSYALFDRMKARDNILYGIPKEEKSGRDGRVRELADLLHLTSCLDQYPRELSGGQQQRVALARMLASRPEVILLDEPFSALDQELKEQIDDRFLEVLASFHGPVIFVSHDSREVRRYCTREIVIHDGILSPKA